jgi:hypothetical protein
MKPKIKISLEGVPGTLGTNQLSPISTRTWAKPEPETAQIGRSYGCPFAASVFATWLMICWISTTRT